MLPLAVSYSKTPYQRKLLFYDRKGKALNFQNVKRKVFPVPFNAPCCTHYQKLGTAKDKTQNNPGKVENLI